MDYIDIILASTPAPDKEIKKTKNTRHPNPVSGGQKVYAPSRKGRNVKQSNNHNTMKNFIVGAFAALLAICALSSCAKDNTPYLDETQMFAENPVEAEVDIYSIALQFDAPADLSEVTIEFRDEYGTNVATQNVLIAEEATVSFTSITKPVSLYTDGLQNVNADGVLPLPEDSVETKAGITPVLLVIRPTE